jgi:hypothetical protein
MDFCASVFEAAIVAVNARPIVANECLIYACSRGDYDLMWLPVSWRNGE